MSQVRVRKQTFYKSSVYIHIFHFNEWNPNELFLCLFPSHALTVNSQHEISKPWISNQRQQLFTKKEKCFNFQIYSTVWFFVDSAYAYEQFHILDATTNYCGIKCNCQHLSLNIPDSGKHNFF